MKQIAREEIASRIERLRLSALDGLAEPLQRAVRSAIPEQSELKDELSGTWLGHPLHPPLTDMVLGAWTSALLLDLIAGKEGERAADLLLAAGVLAAVPTAAAGLSDWAELRGGSRRVGTVHALGNRCALLLHTYSWLARRRGDRGRGIALSALGYGLAAGSAWLGGHLSFARGVGVNQTAEYGRPLVWGIVECDEADLKDQTLTGAHANGTSVLLIRKGELMYALADRCSHRGCSLHEGTLADDTVICPCHSSTFGLDGTLLKGPATSPQPSFEVRAYEGKIEIRRRDNDN
jgi:nitrite reductase/ring-hydroxylating ferredoxin subunit/uncharacterized membrane protein